VANNYTTSAINPGNLSGAASTTLPYLDSTTGSPQAYVNPQSFQLLCPGLDGKYGSTTDKNPGQYPKGSNYDPNFGLDDMTNFTKGATVGDDTQ
jgi:hypothetical protein